MKKILSFLLLSTFILTSCGKTQEVVVDTSVKPKFVTSQVVWEKSFVEDLKLIGKVASSQETSVSPLASWLIKSLNVKVWDRVKAGDILATIDTQSNLTNISLNNAQNAYNNTLVVYNASKEALEKNLDTAKLQYENALTTRDNTYTSTQKQLEIVQSQLDAVSKQKWNTTASSESSLVLANESLENAKLALENFNKNYDETFKSLDIKKSTLVSNMRVAVDNSMATIDGSLNSIDNVLWVTPANKNVNDSYEIYLSAKNSTYKNDAEVIFAQVNPIYVQLKSKYSQDLSYDALLAFYSELITLNNKMVTLHEKMIGVLDNSITSTTFSETTLSTLKTSIKTYQSQVIWLKSTLVGLNNSLIDLENTIASTKVSLWTQKSSLEQGIKMAQATLNNTKNSLNTSIDSISSTENTTKIQLESTMESIRSSREAVDNAVKIANNQYIAAKANYESQLAGTRSQLDNASGQKNSLSQQFDNALIKAPFDWVITARNIEVGGSVSQATPAFSIANESTKIVKLDVSSDNVKYLSVGKQVQIDKNGKTSTWFISVLWASADSTTKMFKVEIMFHDLNSTQDLILGDYVDIYIVKESSNEKFIVIPFSSIIVGSNDSYTVYVVWKNNLVEERKVTLWASNSTEVIITSGIKIWDKVIVSGVLNLSVWDTVQEM